MNRPFTVKQRVDEIWPVAGSEPCRSIVWAMSREVERIWLEITGEKPPVNVIIGPRGPYESPQYPEWFQGTADYVITRLAREYVTETGRWLTPEEERDRGSYLSADNSDRGLPSGR